MFDILDQRGRRALASLATKAVDASSIRSNNESKIGGDDLNAIVQSAVVKGACFLFDRHCGLLFSLKKSACVKFCYNY